MQEITQKKEYEPPVIKEIQVHFNSSVPGGKKRYEYIRGRSGRRGISHKESFCSWPALVPDFSVV